VEHGTDTTSYTVKYTPVNAFMFKLAAHWLFTGFTMLLHC